MPFDLSPPANYDDCMAQLVIKYHNGGRAIDVEEARRIVSAFNPDIERAIFATGLLQCMRTYTARQQAKPLDVAARDRIAASRRRTKADTDYCRQHRVHPSELVQHKARKAVAILEENAGKAAKYDRVVELLDTWMVGNMRLGECTKAKLLAEAARCKVAASDLSIQAEVYARLAGHMRDGETVRVSTKRETMLDILLALKP